MGGLIKGRIKTIELDGIRQFYRKYRPLLWFFSGVVLGTACMNAFCGYFYDKLGIYTEYFIDAYGNIEVENIELFKYALWEYSLEVFVIFLMSPTFVGSVFLNFFCGYKGTVIALLISSYVLKYGVGGVLIYILSIFPHYVTYGIMLWIMLSFGRLINDKIKIFKKSRYMGGSTRESIKIFFRELTEGRRILPVMICVPVLVVLTAFLDAYVNTALMDKLVF